MNTYRPFNLKLVGDNYYEFMERDGFLRYGKSILMKRGWRKEDAEDIASEALIKAARFFKKGKRGHRILYCRAVFSVASNWRRRYKKFAEAGIEPGIDYRDVLGSLMASSSTNSVNIIKKREECEYILQSLSEKDRDIIKMRFWEDKELNEIGELIGISGEAIRQRIQKSLKRMREVMRSEDL